MQDRGILRRSQLPQAPAPASQRTGPEASLGEVWSASRTIARGDRSDAETQRLAAAWDPVLDALELPDSESPAGFVDDVVRGAPLTRWSTVIKGRTGRGSQATRAQQEVALLAMIAERRQRDPAFLKDVPTDIDGYRQWVVRQEQARRGEARDVLSRSSGTAAALTGFAGGTAEMMLDPVNIASLPLGGGGRTVAQTVLREALVGATVEGAQQPFVAGQRAAIGEELTAGEAVMNVTMGGVGAGIIGGAAKGIEIHGRPAIEGTIAAIVERLPEAARKRVFERFNDPSALTDADLPDIAEAAIGRDSMTGDEAAALALLRREFQIDAINPFVPNGAGVRAHRERLDDALRAVLADPPPASIAAPVALPPRPRAATADLRGGTAIGTGTVSATPAREALKTRIGVVESAGGTQWANPRSSARGKYQFVNGTWLAYYKRRFGSQGLSDADILAKRRDASVQDVLMDDLLADNASFLRQAGEAETAGNLYLTHFAGQGGARKLFAADPNARAIDVLGAGVIKANPFLEKMTAGDVIAWAHRKMGGDAPPRSGARVELADVPSEAGYRDTLQAELDRLEAERLALEADTEMDGGAAARIAEAIDQDAVPVELDEAIELPPLPDAPPAPAIAPTRSAELREQVQRDQVAAAVPEQGRQIAELADQVQALVAQGKPTAVPRMAAALGVDEATAYRALTSAAERNGSGLRIAKSGRVSRTPSRNAAKDVLYIIAEAGGIIDDGQHRLLTDRGLKKLIGGVGDVIYPQGGRGRLTIDDAGELLHEMGLFVDRPTERQMLEMLEDAIMRGRKFYPPDQLGGALDRDAARQLTVEMEAAQERGWAYASDHLPHDLIDDDLSMQVAELVELHGLEPGRAVVEAIDYRARRNSVMVGDHLGDVDDATLQAIEDDALAAIVGDWDPGTGGGGPDGPAVPGNAGGSGAYVETDGRGGASLEELERIWSSPEYFEGLARVFDDPDGAAAKAQADSLAHDVRAEIEPASLDLGEAADPAIAKRQRQEARLKADAPMRAATDQESTIGSPLFDAVDQYGLRLDEEGDKTSAIDLLARLDDEEAAIKTIRECL